MANMKNMSVLFFAAGLVMVLAVLIFFCHLFINKQRKRTAIERSLGLSKKKCMRSLLSGLLLLIVISSLIGSLAGAAMTKEVAKSTEYKFYYDTRYGNTFASTGTEETDSKATDIKYDLPTMIEISAGMAAAVILTGLTVSVIMISISLKKEPLELLGTTAKE